MKKTSIYTVSMITHEGYWDKRLNAIPPIVYTADIQAEDAATAENIAEAKFGNKFVICSNSAKIDETKRFGIQMEEEDISQGIGPEIEGLCNKNQNFNRKKAEELANQLDELVAKMQWGRTKRMDCSINKPQSILLQT